MACEKKRGGDSRAKAPLHKACNLNHLTLVAAKLRTFATYLNDDSGECECCGHLRYTDFEQHSARKELLAAADKIERWRDSLRERAES